MQFTGGTSFQRSLNDLVKTNGVDACVRYDDDDVDADGGSGGVGVLGYVEDFPKDLNVYGFGVDADEAMRRVRDSVTNPILRSIDRGNRGAYVVSHHINTPGILMLEKHLEWFRGELRARGCELAVVATAREPIIHRVSEHLKFHPMKLEKDLKTLLGAEPAFPQAGGSTPFKQMREFLFMDEFPSAAEQMATDAGRENAGDGAPAAIEANAVFEAVTRAAERLGVSVDAFLEEGGFEAKDLTEEERAAVGATPAEAARRFARARDAVVRVADGLIRKFDITLVRTEDQGEGLERLAYKMDWHPELMRARGTDAFETLRRNARDVMNAHTFASAEDEVDVDAVPFATRESLRTWTELDLALYVLAAAQAERFAAERSEQNESGNENANVGDPDCPPPNLRDAAALAAAARLDAARPDGVAGGTRFALDAVRGASGCLPRAVSSLAEASSVPVGAAEKAEATEAEPASDPGAEEMDGEREREGPADVTDGDGDDENEVAALLREAAAAEAAAAETPPVPEPVPEPVSDRAGMGRMERPVGGRAREPHHSGAREARVERAIGLDASRFAAALGRRTRSGSADAATTSRAFAAGAQERRVEEALGFGRPGMAYMPGRPEAAR